MPRTLQKQKVKDTRTELKTFYRCLSTSHLRNPLSFNCYQRQNLTMEYFQMSHLPSRGQWSRDLFLKVDILKK